MRSNRPLNSAASPSEAPTAKALKTPAKRPRGGSGKLSLRMVDDYLKFVFFLAFIGMIYIWNSHLADKQIRQRDRLKKEVDVLKAEYVNRKASLSEGTRYTELIARFDSIGLRRLDEPPYKLLDKQP